jgi:hypothetical protein
VPELTNAQAGLKKGSIVHQYLKKRTIAASHNEGNQPVPTLPIYRFRTKKDLTLTVEESDSCGRLAYVKIPLLLPALIAHLECQLLNRPVLRMIVVFLSFRHFSPFNVALYLGVRHEPTTI